MSKTFFSLRNDENLHHHPILFISFFCIAFAFSRELLSAFSLFVENGFYFETQMNMNLRWNTWCVSLFKSHLSLLLRRKKFMIAFVAKMRKMIQFNSRRCTAVKGKVKLTELSQGWVKNSSRSGVWCAWIKKLTEYSRDFSSMLRMTTKEVDKFGERGRVTCVNPASLGWQRALKWKKLTTFISQAHPKNCEQRQTKNKKKLIRNVRRIEFQHSSWRLNRM